MASRLALLPILALILACGGTPAVTASPNPTEDPVIKTVRYAWTATVTGTITGIDRDNVDKSGKNPKWLIRIHVEPTKVEAPPGKTLVGEVEFLTRESELLPMLDGTMPKVGDVFVGTGTVANDDTNMLQLTGASLQ